MDNKPKTNTAELGFVSIQIPPQLSRIEITKTPSPYGGNIYKVTPCGTSPAHDSTKGAMK
jgi:hypothetical protein